jgi:hypothetical protein
MYYILYLLFVLFQGATNGAYATFKGSSQRVYSFLGTVTAIGSIAFIASSVIHFFIIKWWIALILITCTLLIVPSLSIRFGRKLFFIVASPFLAIIFGGTFLIYQLYLLGVVKIISVQ